MYQHVLLQKITANIFGFFPYRGLLKGTYCLKIFKNSQKKKSLIPLTVRSPKKKNKIFQDLVINSKTLNEKKYVYMVEKKIRKIKSC